MMRKEAANVSETETHNEVQFGKCCCCGLTEECTEAYIMSVKERNQGRWLCGLCAEAVKDEMLRSCSSSSSSSSERRRIEKDEAMNRHMTFCKKFRAKNVPRIEKDEAMNRHMTFCKKFRAKNVPPNATDDELISAVKQLMLRSLESPRSSPRSYRLEYYSVVESGEQRRFSSIAELLFGY
ncbi:hypothetical protein T459_35350 [Capsicum annuum]|uniref:Uncharacterized protein n=1 Tax=Capsicum annuum TaxID=4072 RepID=A0A2G2XTI4_CAPAN|nr:hypothetical protein T459_35350 [Capsicum annuum]